MISGSNRESSIRFQVRPLCDCGVAIILILEELGELVGHQARRFQPKRDETLHDLRRLQNFSTLGGEPDAQVKRHSGRREKTNPATHVETTEIARLGDCRYVWQGNGTIRTGNAQCLETP